MEAIAVVTLLALLQFFLFGFQVGRMRIKHGVRAPATTGAPEFERMFRVQQNTLEQLVIFLPALWIYGYYGNPMLAAIAGLVFIVGRFVYKSAYLGDPTKRSAGFGIGLAATAFLVIAALIAAGRDLYVLYTA